MHSIYSGIYGPQLAQSLFLSLNLHRTETPWQTLTLRLLCQPLRPKQPSSKPSPLPTMPPIAPPSTANRHCRLGHCSPGHNPHPHKIIISSMIVMMMHVWRRCSCHRQPHHVHASVSSTTMAARAAAAPRLF